MLCHTRRLFGHVQALSFVLIIAVRTSCQTSSNETWINFSTEHQIKIHDVYTTLPLSKP